MICSFTIIFGKYHPYGDDYHFERTSPTEADMCRVNAYDESGKWTVHFLSRPDKLSEVILKAAKTLNEKTGEYK